MSIRLLITQHNMLFGKENSLTEHIGCIDPSCNISEIIESKILRFKGLLSKFILPNINNVFCCRITGAVNNASELCEQYYMVVPSVEISVSNGN